MSKSIEELESILDLATKDLPKVTSKKMFGCHATWADGNVFALIWKEGRIGVKLPDEKAYASLLALTGAMPWKAGTMQMAHWVLVPKQFHDRPAEIKKWTKMAHGMCIKLEKKTKKPIKKKAK